MSLRILLFFLILFPTLGSNTWAADKIYIDVGKPTSKKSLVALPPFQYYGSKKNLKDLKLGETLFRVVNNDLLVSSLFQFIRQEAFLEDTSKVGLRPAPGTKNGFSFKKWTPLGVEFLVRGGYKSVGNKINLEVYVYYVPQGKLVFGKNYESPKSATRKLGHTFSNDFLKALTGKKGMFNTKVVASRALSGKSVKEIYVMDWDGANLQKISNHRSIAISPAWSPDGKKVAYTAFAYHKRAKTRNADLFMYDLEANKRWLVSYRRGSNSGAVFFPNGRNLFVTLTKGGGSDIYKIDLKGKIVRQVTNGPNRSMNVEPAISADGRKVAFSSDRSGEPMIYTMGINGSGVVRRTFAGRYNASPTWSPDGSKIAFAGYDKKHFDIFLMNSDGTGLKRLTSARKKSGRMSNNEDPSFSPDGRHIIFVSDRTGTSQLFIVNLDGSNERRITFDRHHYFKPKWSQFLDE